MISLNDDEEFYNSSAVLMVTYNTIPNFERIRNAFKFVRNIIIIDNNSNSKIKAEILKFSKLNPKCIPIFNNINVGISKAYNAGVNYAKSIELEWLFFLDGDADFGDQYFIDSYKMLREAINLRIRLGLICPIVSDTDGYKKIKFKDSYCFISSSITSGIMINVNTFLKVGGYDESIFVEAADLNFTRKILQNGMKICRINKVLIIQSFGKEISLNENFFIKLVNFVSHISSIITLRYGRLNVIRSRYPIYDPRRRNNYYKNLIKSSGLIRKPFIRLYSVFGNMLDIFFFKIVGTKMFEYDIEVNEEED
jgi:rhamnosyltransferase